MKRALLVLTLSGCSFLGARSQPDAKRPGLRVCGSSVLPVVDGVYTAVGLVVVGALAATRDPGEGGSNEDNRVRGTAAAIFAIPTLAFAISTVYGGVIIASCHNQNVEIADAHEAVAVRTKQYAADGSCAEAFLAARDVSTELRAEVERDPSVRTCVEQQHRCVADREHAFSNASVLEGTALLTAVVQLPTCTARSRRDQVRESVWSAIRDAMPVVVAEDCAAVKRASTRVRTLDDRMGRWYAQLPYIARCLP